jgi:hypothetical protein
MNTARIVSSILLLLATTGPAFAKMNPKPIMIMEGGLVGGAAGGGGGGGSGSSGGSCETSSWGNSSAGGVTTACSFPDGSSTWFMSEWGLGWSSSVYGSAGPDGTVTETAWDDAGV